MKKSKWKYKILAPVLVACLFAALLPSLGATAMAAGTSDSLVDAGELFTERDLDQSPELSGAKALTVSDGENLTITEEGVYVISGSASECTVVVDAPDAKVQLVLDGVNIFNSDFPCIYVRSADKVFVTTVSDSSLVVTGSFTGDGETKTDGAIYSKADLTLNGSAALTVNSTANGVVSKDDLKVTGGSYVINAASHALEGKDSIRISGGSFVLTAGKDGLHTDNNEAADKGFLFISGGEFTIRASDDGLHAVSFLQIDGGTFSISASEGIESTCVLINGGEISISMGAGDTDGVDSNGDLSITGGTISVTGNSCFDVDGSVSFTGGTVCCNGQQVSTIPVQMMGGGMGGMRGGWGGMGGRRG